VLDLYVDGLTGQDIAEKLGMARNTVRSYIRNIRGKYRTAGFPVRNKIELVHAAHSPATITKPRTIRKNATPDATPRVEENKARRDAEETLPLPRPAPPPALSPTMTVADLSRILDLDEKTVRKHLTSGTIPAYRVRHHWLIFTAEVRALFDDPEKTADSTSPIDILAGYGETITPRELQALFQSSRQTINLWLKQGILPGYWIGTRWLIHTHQLRHALTAYSNQRSQSPSAVETEGAPAPRVAARPS
jgi:excisionase family DNA binding protein